MVCSKVRPWEGNDDTKGHIIESPRAPFVVYKTVTPQIKQSQEALVTVDNGKGRFLSCAHLATDCPTQSRSIVEKEERWTMRRFSFYHELFTYKEKVSDRDWYTHQKSTIISKSLERIKYKAFYTNLVDYLDKDQKNYQKRKTFL